MKKAFFTIAMLFVAMATVFAQKYEAKLILSPGMRVPFSAQQRTEQKIVAGAKDMQTIATQQFKLSYTVAEKRGDNYLLNCVISELSIKMEGPDGTVEASSTNTEDKSPLASQIQKMVNRIVQVEVTPSFQLVGEVKPLTEGVSKEEAAAIYQQFDNIFANLYPGEALEVNKELVKKDENSTQKITLLAATDMVYAFQNTEEFEQDIQGLPLKGTSTTSYEMHRPTGIPINGLVTSSATGSQSMQGMNIDLTLAITLSFDFIQE